MVAGALLDRDDARVRNIDAVAKAARQGEFNVKGGLLDKGSRLAAQGGAGQQAVWDDVATNNASLGSATGSGTFSANYYQRKVVAKLDPYIKGLRDPILKEDRVVGVIVAINGKIEMADIYESTPLLRKFWPQLLKSYALDAAKTAQPAKAPKSKVASSDAAKQPPESSGPLIKPAGKADAPKDCSVADVQAFLDGFAKAKAGKGETSGGLVVTKRSASSLLGFSASEATGGEDSNVAGAIHSTIYAK